MRIKQKFNLGACPLDICEHIVDMCVQKRIAELSKQGVRLLIVLITTSWVFRSSIMSLSKGWMRFVHNKEFINTQMQQDWFSLTHYLLRRCFNCNRLCYQKVTRDTFKMILHKECLMGLTETVWFFDYRMLKRTRVKDRLGPMMCAVVDYNFLTPEKIRNFLPYADCEGKNRIQGSYTYQRFFIEPNHLVPLEHTLFGWLGLTPDRLEYVRCWYKHKHSGYLNSVPKFPATHRRIVKQQAVSSKTQK